MEQENGEDKEAILTKSLKSKLSPSFTASEAIEATGFSGFQLILCAICGLSWLAGAMEIMLITILSPSLRCEWNLTPFQQALCTTTVFAGWMVASPFWGRICDVYGRRMGLMAASVVGFVFGVLTTFAPSFYLFLAGRFWVGFAVAGLPQSVTQTAEFLPSASRAKWLMILKSFWAIGTVILTALALFILPNLGWRYLVFCASIPLAIFGLCCWWLPESIRYDVAQGRVVEARATLDRIARFNGKSLPEGELTVEKVEGNSAMTDLLKPSHRRTSLLLWVIWTLFCLLYYGIAIYTTLLLHSPVDQCGTVHATEKKDEGCRHLTTDNYIDIILTSISEVPGYFILMYVVDYGYKPTFAIGFLLYSACCVVLTVCTPRFITIGALFVARAVIGAIYQAGYLYTGDVYPTTLRAQGLGVASGWGRFGTMITSVITQMLVSHNIIFPAIFYAGGGILGAILAILLPIETSGKKAIKTSRN